MRKTLDILTLIIFFITLAVYLPANSLIESLSTKNKFVSFLPQGWAFFTKDPQETKAIAYFVNEGTLKEFNKTGNRLKYLTGLKRTQRVQNRELSDILSRYSELKIKKEFKTKDEALRGTFNSVHNNSVSKRLCGKVIINVYKETPWIWFSNNIKEKPIDKYVTLDINCG